MASMCLGSHYHHYLARHGVVRSAGIGIVLVILVDESYNFRPKEVDTLVGMNHLFVVDFNRHTTDIVSIISKNNHANVLSSVQGDVLIHAFLHEPAWEQYQTQNETCSSSK
jgi:hypothetical protein